MGHYQQNLRQSLELGINTAWTKPPLHNPLKHPKSKNMSAPKKNLTPTTMALTLLRFNVALQIAVVAMLANLVLCIATFSLGMNALYCAFGTDCIIGVITSAILIWRFASHKTEKVHDQPDMLKLLTEHTTDYGKLESLDKFDRLLDSVAIDPDDGRDHARELWSTFWLGQVMVVSGFVVIIRTILEVVIHFFATNTIGIQRTEQTAVQLFRLGILLEFSSPTDPSETQLEFNSLDGHVPMDPLFTLASISLGLNLFLMVLKLLIYLALNSNSMLIEGINSFISALFAAVAMLSVHYSNSVQYLDQTVSILFGIFLVLYGAYNVMHTIGETMYESFHQHDYFNAEAYEQL